MSITLDDGIVVRHAAEQSRYELVDDESVIGVAEYREPDETRRDFTHTEVDDAYGGRGLASKLVGFALAGTRDAGRRIIPHCPYVAGWIQKHEGQFDDIVDWPS